MNRDDFKEAVKVRLAKSAAYFCSNPDCRELTLKPDNQAKVPCLGVSAHITAASQGGPRYDSSLTPEKRGAFENGIFLCSNCAALIDKNNGSGHSKELLNHWKEVHQTWVKGGCGGQKIESKIVVIDGHIEVSGAGEVTGIDIQGPTKLMPGTKVKVDGIGKVTGIKSGSNNPKE